LATAPLARDGIYRLEGRVTAIEANGRGHRLGLDRIQLERAAADAAPWRARVTLRSGGDDLLAGDRVRLLARLQRPLAPSLPGGFDFGRQAWFDGLGGLGFALGKPERLAPAGQSEPGQSDLALAVAGLRARITSRIMAVAPDTSGAVAAALVTGVRAGIGQDVWRDFQISGLAHILSISGLHMVLVAGVLVMTLRFLLALIQPLALRIPVKKLAAALAIPGTGFYLLLAGATVPTQRSFLMITIGLVALILDRQPLSMRLIAWSATVVLLIRPDALLGASFQLSFAAVVALSATYETPAVQRLLRPGPEAGPIHKAGLYVGGVAATTLIASSATAPIGAFHFQNVPTYGVLANLLAVPLTSFWIMPAGMAAMALMPLGLDGWALRLMTGGVELLLAIAHWAAALPGSSLRIGLLPTSLLVLFSLGGLWLALWRRPWRWLGALPCAAAILLALLHRPPDLLVDPRLDMAARRTADGRLVLAEWRRHGLVKDGWLRGEGVRLAERWPRPGDPPVDGIACDAAGCTVRLGAKVVALVRRMDAFSEDCRLADLVIARIGPERCAGPARLIGPRALLRSGGLAIGLDGGRLTVRTVAEGRGDWPWAAPLPSRYGGTPPATGTP
jgi:competence protein ComEC